MWTSQVCGHHDKMDRTKHTEQNTEYTKTQQTLGNKYFVLSKPNNIFDDTTTFNLLTCICVFTIHCMNTHISNPINIQISNMHIVFSYLYFKRKFGCRLFVTLL